MNTQNILTAIDRDFVKTYRGAAAFVDSGSLWNFCIDTIRDPVLMGHIIFANDLGVPPVKSLVQIYRYKMNPADSFTFTTYESRSMGALMGFVFKFVLSYTGQKERCKVDVFGIQTAARFTKAFDPNLRPDWELTEE